MKIYTVFVLQDDKFSRPQIERKVMSRSECSRLDRPDVLRVLFYPRRDASPDDEQTVRFWINEDIEIGGKIHPAAENAPLILLFHGNGEIAADYDFIASLYNEIGISLMIADYRGYGKSGGTPTASTLLNDAIEVFRSVGAVLSERKMKPEKLFVMGRSLGSAPALEIASRAGDKISGLIIESGFVDTLALIERVGGPRLSHLNEEGCGFNNIAKIKRVNVPALVIHGEEDFIIPMEEGELLFRSCGSKKKEFLSIPGAGHNDLLMRDRRGYFGAIRKLVFE
jgi:alpha-beta hydrolase superfamily lysophospholipase